MAQIIPIRDLKNTAEIYERCTSSNEPIFITKNGYGGMVLMSMDLYNRKMAKLDLLEKLKVAEDQLKSGVQAFPAETVLSELREKYAKLQG